MQAYLSLERTSKKNQHLFQKFTLEKAQNKIQKHSPQQTKH